ncbi:MAG: carbohydrate kinase family protein [Candidatus Thorarchaeota archaeon]
MTKANSSEPLWPYLLFLPTEHETRDEFVRSVLASRVARGVLSSFGEDGRVLQRDLVEQLPHSNKSVLSYLKTLQKFDLIQTSTTIHNGKRVVYHELTKNGWGLARFYFEGLPYDVEELTAFLLEDYLTRLATLYRDQGIPESTLFEIFARMRAKAILEGSKTYSNPAFMIFGASAFNTAIECTKLPDVGGMASCNPPSRYPGGPTVDLALSLARDGHETVLVSSVGNDMDGWNIITNLIQGNVDVRHIVVEDEKHTNESIIISDGDQKSRMLVGVSPTTSLSITSPSQVPWSELESSKAVYIGEVFVEVAATIVAHATARGIPTIYRCSVPYLELGLDRLKPVLSQVDILLISNRGWSYLKENFGASALKTLREYTGAAIVIKQSKSEYVLSFKNDDDLTIPSKLTSQEITTTFVHGLIVKIAETTKIPESVKHAISLEDK